MIVRGYLDTQKILQYGVLECEDLPIVNLNKIEVLIFKIR